MAKKESQKVKGCRKCGRSSRKGLDMNLSMFVRDKISGHDYFKLTNQTVKV